MKIRKSIYPKTKRLSYKPQQAEITEKLDGSNLAIGKLEDKIYICLRKNIIEFSEIEEYKGLLYKGLYSWLLENKENLKEVIYDGSVICGEWLGMGKLKYPQNMMDKRFYMFAKARFTKELDLKNIMWDREKLGYCFISGKIPDFIEVVPFVRSLDAMPTVEDCDKIYSEYAELKNRNIEGFVINYLGSIKKYVRMKSGKLEKHRE